MRSRSTLPVPVAPVASVAFVAWVALVAFAGCPKQDPRTLDAGAAEDAGARDASEPRDGGDGGDAEAAEDEVKPVYPMDAGPAEPLAARFCAAMGARQEERRAECCKVKPGVVLTQECTRMLSAALATKALRIDPAALDACVAAVESTFAGCDWVGPFPPAPPAACQRVFEGLLPEGARCRSSLECAKSLRCHGVGPTTAGKCGPGKAIGESCGSATDALAGYARQSIDVSHPECKAACVTHRCAEPAADGAACVLSAACREGSLCVDKKCQKRAPARIGQACPGGACEAGGECVLGKCAAKKVAGAACATDFECLGGCLKPKGQARGVCGMRCDLR